MRESHAERGGTVSFQEKRGFLYRLYCHPNVNQGKPVRQVIVSVSLCRRVMELAYDSLMSGHLGVKKTTHRILTAFYWPGIRSDVSRFCRSCKVCQKTVSKGNIPKALLGRIR